MTDNSDSCFHQADASFSALFDAWLSLLHAGLLEYAQVINRLEQTLPEVLGGGVHDDGLPLLLAQSKQSASKLLQAIDTITHPGLENKAEYLSMLFADLRNPISSLAGGARLLQISQSSTPREGSQLYVVLERLAALGEQLRTLLEALLRLREQYRQGGE
jgi:signal transduction histidine kinase